MKTPLLSAAIVAALMATTASAAGPGGDRPTFADLDADGNGQVTLEELQAAGPAGRFAAADTNGDGVLSADELTAMATAAVADRVTRMIADMDENGDGALSADEMAPRGGMDGDRSARMFDVLDSNNDDVVTQDEFDAMAAEMEGRGSEHRGGEHGERGGRGGHGGHGGGWFGGLFGRGN